MTNRIIVWQSMQIVHDVERPVIVGLAALGSIVLLGGYAIGALIARRGLQPLTSGLLPSIIGLSRPSVKMPISSID